MRLLHYLRRFNDVLEQAIAGMACTVVAFIVAALFIGAATRYVTGIGYDWLAELPPQLVPWIVFPMIGVLLRRDRHVSVDVLVHVLRGRSLLLLRAFIFAVSTVACTAFAVVGIYAVAFFQRLGQLSTTELEFPLWWLYASFPIGFALSAIFSLEGLLLQVAALGKEQPEAAVPQEAER